MKFRIDSRLQLLSRTLLCALLLVSVVSTGWAGGKKRAAPKIDPSKLVWPPPPDEARVLWVGQYSGEFDLLEKKQTKGGFLERLAGVTVTPEERPKMMRPYGIAVDSKGLVYVADTPQHLVFVYDLEHKKLTFRGDKAPANLQLPIGVALDGEDRLFVSDSKAHQITCFTPEGDVKAVFGAQDLQRPAGLAVDDALRRLYVADVGAQRIAVFDIDTLKLVRYFADFHGKDKDEDRSGALTNPNSIAVDPDGLIYVTDAIVPRVFVYDTEGNFVRVWGKRGDAPGMFGRPKGIAIDRDGHVYVADAQINRLQIFSPEGKPLLSVGGVGLGPGQFMLMAGVAIDRQNRIIAVDQLPARIEVFRYITDEQAEAARKGQKPAGSTAAAAPAKAPAAAPAASPGPTVEELQKELAELKAKLAAQEQQKKQGSPDGGTPAEKPANETPASSSK